MIDLHVIAKSGNKRLKKKELLIQKVLFETVLVRTWKVCRGHLGCPPKGMPMYDFSGGSLQPEQSTLRLLPSEPPSWFLMGFALDKKPGNLRLLCLLFFIIQPFRNHLNLSVLPGRIHL